MSAEVRWSKVSNRLVTRVGGSPSNYPLAKWPHVNGQPLPFLAQVIVTLQGANNSYLVYVFCDDSLDGSWQAEDGANAVLLAHTGTVPDWVNLAPVESPVLRLEQSYQPSYIMKSPEWLQGDETPENSVFLLQVPSQIDSAQEFNLGGGYGTGYVFLDHKKGHGTMVWQS